MLLVVLFMCLVAAAHRYLQGFAPSDLIVSRVRRGRPSTRVAGSLLALATAFALGAIIAADLASDGGPGWLHLLVLLWTWNAMKFLWAAAMCPIWNLSGRTRFATDAENGQIGSPDSGRLSEREFWAPSLCSENSVAQAADRQLPAVA